MCYQKHIFFNYLMHEEQSISQIITAAVIVACGDIFPVLFHLIGLGSVFLPMFIPLAAGSFFLSPRMALGTGAITPLASAFLTGMPPLYPPIAVVMMAELAIFCSIISFLRHHSRMHAFFIIAIAMVADRLLLYAVMAVVMPLFGISAIAFTIYDMIKSSPGILILVMITPIAVKGIDTILKKNT